MANDITREEMDAKLATAEARTTAAINALGSAISGLRSEMSDLRREMRDDYKGTRTTVLVTAVASVIAIAGLTYTAQSMLLQAFQTGLSVVQTKASN